MAKGNPFRFSTKYQDDESDLLYYGYRYYNASTGRWVSRDPLGEHGGQNLYALVSNAVLDDYDALGLLHSGQILQINTGTGSGCTARVVYYSPLPQFAYGKRTIDTKVGAQLRIEISCDCSGCGCYKWRQHYSQYEDEKRTLANVLDAPKGQEWYPEGDSPGDGGLQLRLPRHS